MRFRYIDEKGREVDLESVEALAARISLGAVRDDMELFDAVADRWAPAAEHEIFQQLQLEAGGGAASVSPLLGAVHSDPDDVAFERPRDVEPVESESAVPAEEDPAAPAETEPEPGGEETDPAPSEPARPDVDILAGGGGLGLSLVGDGPADDVDAPGSGAEGGDGFDMGLEGMDLTLESGDGDGDEESLSAGQSGFMDADSLDLASSADLQGNDAVDGLIPAGDYEMGAGSAPPMFGEGDAFEMEGFETGPADPPATPGWAPPERSPHPDDHDDDGVDEFITDRDAFSAPKDRAPDSRAELERTQDEAGARKAAARAKAQERLQESGVAVAAGETPGGGRNPMGILLVAAVAAIVVSGGSLLLLRQFAPTLLGGSGSAAPVEEVVTGPVLPPAPNLTTEEAEALALGLGAGMTQALSLLDSLTAAVGLGEGPPVGWPRGQYLAEASTFPEVAEYFRASVATLDPMASLMTERLRFAALAEMEGQGIEAPEAEALLDRSGRWVLPLEADIETLVGGLQLGAASAVDLHSYLVSVEDRIRYDPFDQPGVSADPVVEAIPLDEEVETEMWARIGSVADEYRAAELQRAALPERVEALGDSIRASAR